MITTLICVGVLLLGIGGVIFYCESYDFDYDWIMYVSASLTVIGVAAAIVCAALIIIGNVSPKYQYEQDMIEYQTIQSQIGKTNDYVTLAENITEYNQKVNRNKKWANNKWTNWFYYDGCEELPYIELEVTK